MKNNKPNITQIKFHSIEEDSYPFNSNHESWLVTGFAMFATSAIVKILLLLFHYYKEYASDATAIVTVSEIF